MLPILFGQKHTGVITLHDSPDARRNGAKKLPKVKGGKHAIVQIQEQL
jgi:hypothetical protein